MLQTEQICRTTLSSVYLSVKFSVGARSAASGFMQSYVILVPSLTLSKALMRCCSSAVGTRNLLGVCRAVNYDSVVYAVLVDYEGVRVDCENEKWTKSPLL